MRECRGATQQLQNGNRGAKYGRAHRRSGRSDLKCCGGFSAVGIVTVVLAFALCGVTLIVYSFVSRYDNNYTELPSYDVVGNGSKSNFGILPNVTGVEVNKILRFGHGSVARGLDSRYWDRDDRRRDENYEEDMEHHSMDSEAKNINSRSALNDPGHNSRIKRVGFYSEAGRNELKLYEEQYKASLKDVHLSNENGNRNNLSDDDNLWKQAEADDEYNDGIDSHDVRAEDGNDKEKQSEENKVSSVFSDFQSGRDTVSNVAKVGDEIFTNSVERQTSLNHFDLDKKSSQHIDEDDYEAVKTPRVDHKRKPKRRKRSGCVIKFMNNAAQLVEPLEGKKFARFSLKYTEVEEEPVGEEQWEPRFAGHQTAEKREKSFLAHDQEINCGFVKGPKGYPSTGFDLKEGDLNYISRCHISVSSCIFGNSDRLRQPAVRKLRKIPRFRASMLRKCRNIVITRLSKRNVCFVMFVDESTLNTLSSEGQTPDRMGFIGLWKIVVVKNLPFTDMRRVGKVPKLLSHRLFPSARYSIWLDSKLRLQLDPLIVLEYFLWRKGYEYAISNHYDRHCIWDEVERNKKLNKYNHTVIDEQFNFYQADGLQRFNASDPNKLLPSNVPEGSFIVRAHTPMSNLFSCLWFNEVDQFTPRDQLSFFYTYQKLRRINPDKPFHLHMFKDCERRAVTKLFHHRSSEKRNVQAVE